MGAAFFTGAFFATGLLAAVFLTTFFTGFLGAAFFTTFFAAFLGGARAIAIGETARPATDDAVTTEEDGGAKPSAAQANSTTTDTMARSIAIVLACGSATRS